MTISKVPENHVGAKYIREDWNVLRKNIPMANIPVVKLKTCAARSFSIVAPQWWNELPLPNNIKQSDNV